MLARRRILVLLHDLLLALITHCSVCRTQYLVLSMSLDLLPLLGLDLHVLSKYDNHILVNDPESHCLT